MRELSNKFKMLRMLSLYERDRGGRKTKLQLQTNNFVRMAQDA